MLFNAKLIIAAVISRSIEEYSNFYELLDRKVIVAICFGWKREYNSFYQSPDNAIASLRLLRRVQFASDF